MRIAVKHPLQPAQLAGDRGGHQHLQRLPISGIDLLAAGLPCPPFSAAGKQLGEQDERNLFPAALRLVDEIRPHAIMIENVPGFATARFHAYRQQIRSQLRKFGYKSSYQLFNACDFGVPQHRVRKVFMPFVTNSWTILNGQSRANISE